jgi:hypothetical protein
VLAGFDGEHGMPGWRQVEWYRSGFLKGGMGNQTAHQQARERLWISPHCLADDRQGSLF